MEKTKFLEESDSRETSIEIMEAICQLANSYEEAVKIWESGDQTQNVYEIVTKNGLLDSTEFCWGANGRNWI